MAYTGLSCAISSKFLHQKPMPAANPCSITRGVFSASSFTHMVHILSSLPTMDPIGTNHVLNVVLTTRKKALINGECKNFCLVYERWQDFIFI